MNIDTVYNIIGILGAFLILLGFYRTSIGQWGTHSFLYELDNLVGATLLVAYQLHHHAYITVVVNVIWAIIAFKGLASYAERRRIAQKDKANSRTKARRKS